MWTGGVVSAASLRGGVLGNHARGSPIGLCVVRYAGDLLRQQRRVLRVFANVSFVDVPVRESLPHDLVAGAGFGIVARLGFTGAGGRLPFDLPLAGCAVSGR